MQTVIDFYSKYGEICENRVTKLQAELEKSLNETEEETGDSDEENDDDKGNYKGEENEEIKTRLKEEKQTDKTGEKNNEKEINSEKELSVNTSEAFNSEETNGHVLEKKDDSPNTEEFDTDLTGTREENDITVDNKLDINDELCIKEIIDRFSKEVSPVHEEL